jgi:DNA gyrase subunit A
VVTENGWGKRTRIADYPVKGRGGLGVQTAKLVEGKGKLVGARVVRDGYQVMLISDGGTVIRMAVDDIKRSGRATQGVIVMRLREAEQVSTLAPVVTGDEDTAEEAQNGSQPSSESPSAEADPLSEDATVAEDATDAAPDTSPDDDA